MTPSLIALTSERYCKGKKKTNEKEKKKTANRSRGTEEDETEKKLPWSLLCSLDLHISISNSH
jgi:hypothetical protein